jgi:hypothetical protein
MTRYEGGTTVPGGYYLNTTSWAFHAVSGDEGVLEGQGPAVRIPGLAVLPAMLALSFVFVVFLPFIGLAMLAWMLSRKASAAAGAGVRAMAAAIVPAWRPGLAFFAGKSRAEKKDEASAPESPVLSDLEKDIAARRDAEKR